MSNSDELDKILGKLIADYGMWCDDPLENMPGFFSTIEYETAITDLITGARFEELSHISIDDNYKGSIVSDAPGQASGQRRSLNVRINELKAQLDNGSYYTTAGKETIDRLNTPPAL